MGKPFGVATAAGRIVRWGDLQRYALNDVAAQSEQLEAQWKQVGDADGVVTPPYSPLRLVELLDVNTWHKRACQVKARDTAGLGWRLDHDGDGDAPAEVERARTFLKELPEGLSGPLQRAAFDSEAIGWGCVELVTADKHPDSEPAGLFHVPSWSVRAHRDGDRWCQIIGAHRRWFRDASANIDVDKRTGHVHPAGSLDPDRRASALMVWQHYSPRTVFYGVPDVLPALRAVAGDASAADYQLSFFDNYGVPRFLVRVSGDFDPGDEDEDGRTELEKAIEEQIAALVERPHSTMILTVPTRGRTGDEAVEVTLEPIDTQVEDASFRLYRADNRDEVLSAHGVDPYRVGVVVEGSLGGTVAAESAQVYRESTLRPRQETLERLLTRYVVRGGFGADAELRLETLDTSDARRDLDMLAVLVDKGAATPRELRRYMADKFALDEDVDAPELDRFYREGQPLDGDGGELDAAAALGRVRDELTTAAAQLAYTPPDDDYLANPRAAAA